MKIDRTLKIKEKYFNAILKYEKPFELRHFYLAPNSVVKLDCIDSNNILNWNCWNLGGKVVCIK